jgi:hypothetical protein
MTGGREVRKSGGQENGIKKNVSLQSILNCGKQTADVA